MIKGTLKFVLFCVTVLLLGQVNISGETVGSHVERRVTGSVKWLGQWVISTQWAKSVGADRFLAQWVEPGPSKKIGKPVEANVARKKNHERITPAEQKALRSLLE